MQFKKYDIPFNKKKSLGQRFLRNKYTTTEIVHALSVEKDETVLEIGPGQGILTEFLVKTGAEIIAVELDQRLIKQLSEKFKVYKNFKLLNKNILDVDLKDLFSKTGKIKVIGNIPYHLTSSIIFKLIEEKEYVNSWVMTIQKEVAERIVSGTDCKTRSILSVITQFYGKPELLFDIPAEEFSPVPKVDSAVIKYTFYEKLPDLPT